MKKLLKCALAIVLTPIVVFVVLSALLYCPPVQRWAVNKIAQYATEKTNMQVTLRDVRLSFPLYLQMDSLQIIKPNDTIPSLTDTIADIKQLVADVRLWPLLQGQIEVDGITLKNTKVNTANLIGDCRVKGTLTQLHLESHGIDLLTDSVIINQANLKGGNLDIALGDTIPKDTTSTNPTWVIQLQKLNLDQTHFALHLPGDTMKVRANFNKANVKEALIDLLHNRYLVSQLDWNGGTLEYHQTYQPRSKQGFDANHISLRNVFIGVDSLNYAQPDLRLNIRQARFIDQSGLAINQAKGYFTLSDSAISLDNFVLKMPGSDIHGSLSMDMNAFTDSNPGKFYANLEGIVAKSDLLPFLTSFPKQLYAKIPNNPLYISGAVEGNLHQLFLKKAKLRMPRMFDFSLDGYVANILNMNNLQADIRVKGRTDDLSVVYQFMPHQVSKLVSIPKGIGWNGHVKIAGQEYGINLNMTDDYGRLNLDGKFNDLSQAYTLSLKAYKMPLQHFLPKLGLNPFSGNLLAKGRGFDFANNKAGITLQADIDQFKYQNYVLDGIHAKTTLDKGKLSAKVHSTNKMIGGDFTIDGTYINKAINGHLKGWLKRIDVHALGIMNEHWVASTYADIYFKTDMQHVHHVNGSLKGLQVKNVSTRSPQILIAGTFDAKADMIGNSLSSHLTGYVSQANLKGLGLVTDPYVASAKADLDISSDLKRNHEIKGRVGELLLNENIDGQNINLFTGSFDMNGQMNGNKVSGNVNGTANHIDLYHLGIVDKPYHIALTTDMSLSTDMKDQLELNGTINNLLVQDNTHSYQPNSIEMSLLSSKDSTYAFMKGGDFFLRTDWNCSYTKLFSSGQNIAKALQTQLANREINQDSIKRLLPQGNLYLETGKNNFFCQLVKQMGYSVGSISSHISSSPIEGLNGIIHADSLAYNNEYQIDKLDLDLKTDAEGLTYALSVINGPNNNYPYKGYLTGLFYEKGIRSHALIKDKADKTGFDLAMQLGMEGSGLKCSITSPQSVLGYKQFTVNEDNYIYLGQDKRISADLSLLASDGAGVQVYTDDEDSTALQNITLSMHQFELEKLFTVLPFTPSISGVMNGDYHVVQTEDALTVSSDISVKNMIYEHCPLGNIGTQLVYMPQSDGSHYVDALITQDDEEVGKLTGTYKSEGDGYLDATFEMDQFPLDYINGFVPDQIVGLKGRGEGNLSVQGALNKLDINGEVYLDSSYLVSVPYGVEMRFADDPVLIDHSRLKFENFEMFAHNDSPLNISGYLDFANFDNMYMDVRMRADNFELIDSKETARSEAYGKAFVNFMGAMRGPLSNLQMRGKLDVLGSTDMTYILKDAELTQDSELDNLVRFTNFSDSISDNVVRPTISGFTMNLDMSIDEQAHILCVLTADHSNYIDLIGGGKLQMSYDPTHELQLQGKYTLSDGTMKYSLPVIPLRTFEIQDGSNIQFTGDPMKPILSITATEHVKSLVSDASSQGRLVDFDCGVRLSKQFPDMGIEFIIEAPDDAQMQNELNTKSTEERSKLAVSMLVSGMYLDNNVGNYAMNSALAGFLQTEVNKITGSALRSIGLDLTANMESSADASGNLHTDYTFKFSKRILNNRLRINLGGRVSTGSTLNEDNGAYFDNFSLDYRLNKNETQYLNLYYEREAFDWLEGNLSEFGVGFSWRRKLRHFKDIFRFRSTDNESFPAVPVDSMNRMNRSNDK